MYFGSGFKTGAISISVIDCASTVATFLCLSSILSLCLIKAVICNILFVRVMFMRFEEAGV